MKVDGRCMTNDVWMLDNGYLDAGYWILGKLRKVSLSKSVTIY